MHIRQLAVSVAAAAFAGGAALGDTYTCMKVKDPPGASFTTLWWSNDSNVIAATTDIGSFLYSRGGGSARRWTPLAAPPVDSGYLATDLLALGVNNAGIVTGTAGSYAALTQGFIYTPGSGYAFVSAPPNGDFPTQTSTEFRAMSSNGLINGQQFDPLNGTSTGFIYNSTANVVAGFQPGFTGYLPTLSDGLKAAFVVPGTVNTSGVFVGSGLSTILPREAYVFNPALGTQDLILVPHSVTAIRGLTDVMPRGTTSACSASSCVRMVGWTRVRGNSSSVPMFLDYDMASGALTAPQSVDCSAALGNPVNGALFIGINNRGLVTGDWLDDAGNGHGMIAYHNVALPAAVVGGSFVFSVPVTANQSTFIDPPTAVGYRFAIGSGDPRFAGVGLPVGLGNDSYTILIRDRAFSVASGDWFDFTANGYASGVERFTVVGIPGDAGLDPADGSAFVTEASFVADGQFTGTMTPLTVADEIRSLASAVDEADVGDRLESDVARLRRANANGDLGASCEALAAFSADLQKAASGRRAGLAEALGLRAAAIAIALGCP